MNNNKRLKPNLIDPLIGKKIVRTLKPPQEDYWAPTKNSFQTIYQKYIKPNTVLIILLVIFLIWLFWRYRLIKNQRQISPSKLVTPANDLVKQTLCSGDVQENTNEYANLLLQLYNQQKEQTREPRVKQFNNRVQPAKIDQPKFAYPMYPYAKGGSLAPSGTR